MPLSTAKKTAPEKSTSKPGSSPIEVSSLPGQHHEAILAERKHSEGITRTADDRLNTETIIFLEEPRRIVTGLEVVTRFEVVPECTRIGSVE